MYTVSAQCAARASGGREEPAERAASSWSARLRERVRSLSTGTWRPWGVLIVLMAAYAVFYGIWSVRRYQAFLAPGFDLGIYDQGLWLLSHFKNPFVTVLGLNLFGDHANFFLVLLLPFYWIAPRPETLLVLQSLALAAGVIPVYLLARMLLKERWLSLLPALAYLLTPALGWLNLENFHPDCFEVPLLLFALYFMVRGRWRPYLVMVILVLLIKEDVSLVLVPVGIYVAICHNRRMGLLTVGLAAAYFCLYVFAIQPAITGASAGHLDSWRIPFGGWGGLLATAVKRPWEVGAYMLTQEKILYVFQLFTPLLLLPLLTWRTLIAVPILFFNLVSNFWYQTNIQYHYTSLLIPVLCVAALLALKRFRSLGVRRVLAGALLAATLFSAYLWGPLPFSRQAGYYPDTGHPQVAAAEEAVSLIPRNAVVAAGDKFASHLTHRDQIYVFPTPFSATYWGDGSEKGQRLSVADEVEYVLDIPSILPEATLTVLAQMQAEGFRVVRSPEENAGVLLLQRSLPGEGTN